MGSGVDLWQLANLRVVTRTRVSRRRQRWVKKAEDLCRQHRRCVAAVGCAASHCGRTCRRCVPVSEDAGPNAGGGRLDDGHPNRSFVWQQPWIQTDDAYVLLPHLVRVQVLRLQELIASMDRVPRPVGPNISTENP